MWIADLNLFGVWRTYQRASSELMSIVQCIFQHIITTCAIFYYSQYIFLMIAVFSISRFSVFGWGPHSGPLEDLNRQSSPENGWGEAYQYSPAALRLWHLHLVWRFFKSFSGSVATNGLNCWIWYSIDIIYIYIWYGIIWLFLALFWHIAKSTRSDAQAKLNPSCVSQPQTYECKRWMTMTLESKTA